MNYKKRKLSVTIPSEIYNEIKQSALDIGWTEEEILGWSLSLGVEEIDNVDKIDKEIVERNIRKNKLNSELESVTKDYAKLSSRNAALRYECFEAFSGNKALALKLTGARAKNRNFKQVLNIACDSHETENRTDDEIIEKYVLTRRLRGGQI